MRATRACLLLTALTALTACGGDPVFEARRLFDAGRYADARKRLEVLGDAEYRSLDARSRTAYALYRGLTLGALGDRKNALAWLGQAKQIEEQNPGSLNPDDAVRLRLAEQQYGPLPSTSDPSAGD